MASIDLGTNTVRLLIVENSSGVLNRILLEREITRLGGGFDRGGDRELAPDAIERSLGAMMRFSTLIADNCVDRVRAVATSVVREAVNGAEFASLVNEKTGIPLEVITGEEEARLTARGGLDTLRIESGPVLLFDVGGGSTEYVYAIGSEIEWTKSIGLGVVHLTEEYLSRDGITPEAELSPLRERVRRVISDELREKNRGMGKGVKLVATAGTPTTLAAIDLKLDRYEPERVNGYSLDSLRIEAILDLLLGMEVSERLRVKGLERGREDVIVPGAIVVLETMREFGSREILVSDGGLLEGVAESVW